MSVDSEFEHVSGRSPQTQLSISPRPAPARLPLICGASLLAAFALGSMHYFPGAFRFASFCSFATGRIGAACCRAGRRCASLVSLCLISLPADDALLTTILLVLVERRLGTTYVRTMPRGIDEAPFPRFFSQEGREIVPVVASEGARELAISTPRLRAFSCGRKTDHLSAIRCVADKDPLFFS